MDLAKIIGELRLELRRLEAAIASMEELAQVRKHPGLDVRGEVPGESSTAPTGPEPQKRRRGRPRKYPIQSVEKTAQPAEEPPAAPPGNASVSTE